MLKHARVGLIVWGAILFLASLISIIAISSEISGSDAAPFIIVLILVMLGGAIMIAFGIVNAAKTASYNREILNQNLIYYGFCPHCGARLDCTIQDFRPHSRYPEGFVYCKVCKKPVSKNAFNVAQMQ